MRSVKWYKHHMAQKLGRYSNSAEQLDWLHKERIRVGMNTPKRSARDSDPTEDLLKAIIAFRISYPGGVGMMF